MIGKASHPLRAVAAAPLGARISARRPARARSTTRCRRLAGGLQPTRERLRLLSSCTRWRLGVSTLIGRHRMQSVYAPSCQLHA